MNQNKKIPSIDPQKVFATLRQMIDREYIFKGNRLKIGEVSEIEEGFYVITSLKNYTMNAENANSFIAECFPVESIMPVASTNSVQTVPASREEGMIDEMTDSMFEIFKQLKKSPTKDVIEQATAMSNTANTMTNMWKLKLSAAKLVKK